MKRYAIFLLVLALLLSACVPKSPDVDPSETSPTIITEESTGIGESVPEMEETVATQPTEVPSEETTEAPTEQVTEKPTEAPTEAPTQKPTQKPTEPSKDYTLSLTKTQVELKEGKTTKLSVKYTGTGTLKWSSNKTSVATVDSNGKVTAKGAGTAYITVTDGTKNATCTVIVVAAATEAPTAPKDYTLSLKKSSLSLEVGDTYTIGYTYTGTGSLKWESSNTSVATVNNSGKVTAKGAGTAYITLKDGTKNATCTVTVVAPATEAPTQKPTEAPTEKPTEKPVLKVNVTEKTITVGNTYQIDYTYTGSASNLTFKSRSTAVATVNSKGVVTAVAAGTTYISVSDGTTTKRVDITVKAATPKATSIDVFSSDGPVTKGIVGDYVKIVVGTSPAEATNDITVTSSNTSVVSVSKETYASNTARTQITLKFKAAGSAKVTITSGDGAATKTYNVTVNSFSCSHGGGTHTPEQFASCATSVLKAYGFSEGASGYLVLTLSDSELTASRAISEAKDHAHSFWKSGNRSADVVYAGTDEKGNHVFHFRRG